MLPEETLNVVLPKVSCGLDETLIALTAGKLDETCARLEEVAGTLQTIIAAIIPMASEDPQIEPAL